MKVETKPKERAMSFTPGNIRANRAGRKTMTRRLIKLPLGFSPPNEDGDFEIDNIYVNGESFAWPYAISNKTGCLAAIPCPYGIPGDRIWSKETYGIHSAVDFGGDQKEGVTNSFVYRADGEREDIKWKSSRFMPRLASRDLYEIVLVKAELLHDISEEDARAEGFNGPAGDGITAGHLSAKEVKAIGGSSLLTWFANLWNSINGPGAWDRNDWVWVIEYKPLIKNLR